MTSSILIIRLSGQLIYTYIPFINLAPQSFPLHTLRCLPVWVSSPHSCTHSLPHCPYGIPFRFFSSVFHSFINFLSFSKSFHSFIIFWHNPLSFADSLGKGLHHSVSENHNYNHRPHHSIFAGYPGDLANFLGLIPWGNWRIEGSGGEVLFCCGQVRWITGRWL